MIPVPVVVTKDNFKEVYESTCKDKPATFLLDGIMSDEEVQQFFVGGKARRRLDRQREVHHRHLEPVHQQRISHADDPGAQGRQHRVHGQRHRH